MIHLSIYLLFIISLFIHYFIIFDFFKKKKTFQQVSLVTSVAAALKEMIQLTLGMNELPE